MTQHNPRDPAYYELSLAERLREPSVLVTILALLVAIYNSPSFIGYRLTSLAQRLWDALVFITPATLVFALDNWRNPPLFPRPPSMLPAAAQPTNHAAKSEAMRRILGVDSVTGGIMASVTNAGRRFSHLGGSTLFDKSNIGQPPGLGNMSNSCYQNSILQGLAALKPLPDYLNIAGNACQELGGASEPSGTAKSLRDLIASLNDSSNNGKVLWTPSVLKSMNTWQQQDAQEYFSKLLDEVDVDIAKALRSLRKSPGLESTESAPLVTASISDDGSAASLHSNDSGYHSVSASSIVGDARSPRNPLEGLVAQRVACVTCGYAEGLSLIPFNCITLSLGMNNHQQDLYERLDAYTKLEAISGVECGKCTLLKAQRLTEILIERSQADGKGPADFPELYSRRAAIEEALEEEDFEDRTIRDRCKVTQKVSSTKTKQAAVARGPQSLVIHMNRSVFDEETGHMFKNLSGVRFPMALDLGPWCLGSADRSTAKDQASESGDSKSATEDVEVTPEEQVTRDTHEEWLLDPKTSMVAGDQLPSRISGPIYELRAVVTHQGRHENGHYICYRKHPRPRQLADEERAASAPPNLAPDGEDINDVDMNENGEEHETAAASDDEVMAEDEEEPSEWWRLSDGNVSRVDEEVVLAQGGVFMLFYDCVDAVPVLSAEESPLLSPRPADADSL